MYPCKNNHLQDLELNNLIAKIKGENRPKPNLFKNLQSPINKVSVSFI